MRSAKIKSLNIGELAWQRLILRSRLRSFIRLRVESKLVEVPAMKYIQVDGVGDPNTSAGYFEFVVPPLEGLWWMDPGPFDPDAKNKWQWMVMIMQPDFVTAEMIDSTKKILATKKPDLDLSKVRYEVIEEGLSVQILHIGPYSQEDPTIEKPHKFVES